MSFANLNLNPQISKALEACGYTRPTPIQAQSIPEILLGKDMVASAQTGTGKTAAFVLPALHRLTTTKTSNNPRILILTPTRELATQITDAVSKYGKFLRCNIVSLVGGMPYRQQLRSLSRALDIVVATPGRLLDHMSNGKLDLSDIEMLILDEADRMLDMGFVDDVKMIASAMPKERQTLLFSATVDDKLNQIIRQLLKNPIRIEAITEQMAPVKITQELYIADHPQHKRQLLMHFLKEQNIFKAIIFSATKVNADRLADELCDEGFAAAALHGDLKQSMRNRTLEQLRRGKVQFLVATDVAARGIDIQDITHVINFDLPKFSEDYVHRIGRTGRAGRSGIAISLALPSDVRHVKNIERLMKQTLPQKIVIGLEPKKQLGSGPSSAGKSHKKKKYGNSRPDARGGRKEFAREGFAARKAKKEFDGGSRDGYAPRRDKKEFSRDGFTDRKPKKEFGNKDSFAPRSEKKAFGNDRFTDRKPRRNTDNQDSFAPRSGKKEFGNDRFAERKPRRDAGSRDSFAPRSERAILHRGKKEFGNNSFADRKPRRDAGSRDSFAPRGDNAAPRRGKKEFGNDRFADRKPRSEFGSRESFAPRRDKKEFGNREGFAARKPRKEFAKSEGFAPRKKKFDEKKR